MFKYINISKHLANLASQIDAMEDEDIDGNVIKPDRSTLKNIKELYKELSYIFYDNRDSITKNINKVSEEEMIAYLDV
jgi:hypothetical protein